jgi:hypothetical protein
MAGATYLSLRDIYPNLTGQLATREQTIPEEADQQGLGVSNVGGLVFGNLDVLKTLGFVGVLVFLLFAFGIVD